MESALAWIGQLAEWVGRFFPRLLLLNTTEGAVKFVRGKHPVLLGPGLHWYWPLLTEIKSWVVARQPLDLPTQTVTTKDGKVLGVGGAMVFRITDAMVLIAHTFHPDKTIRVIAAGVIHEVCSQSTWDELQMAKNDGALIRELRRTLRRKLMPYGVRVLHTTLTDFAPMRVYKLVQSATQDAA